MFHGLFERIGAQAQRTALATDKQTHTYEQLRRAMDRWRARLQQADVAPGAIVALPGEYDLETVSLFLTLLREGHVAVALPRWDPNRDQLLEVSCADYLVDLERARSPGLVRLRPGPRPELLRKKLGVGQAGLVVFSSGTTGESKAALFDFEVLSRRFAQSRRDARILAFLHLDHLGGINTLLHTLSAGGTLVTVPDRNPETVGHCIQELKVDVLPATPTFLRMLLIGRVHQRWDLSSLRLITYGTEPMPDATLEHLIRAFPGVRLKQTYGLSELGVLPTRTPRSSSLWIELGGLGCETKVVDGRLQIRSETAMLGYLNAPSPFDSEGWYDTQDMVETKGSMIRILGRASEVINIGGEKVHPVEIETVLLDLPNVAEAAVWGKANPLTGQVVAARVRLCEPEDEGELQRRLYRHCRARLAAHKIPALVELSREPLIGQRLKKAPATPAFSSADASHIPF